jgi:hypothetical protein
MTPATAIAAMALLIQIAFESADDVVGLGEACGSRSDARCMGANTASAQ